MISQSIHFVPVALLRTYRVKVIHGLAQFHRCTMALYPPQPFGAGRTFVRGLVGRRAHHQVGGHTYGFMRNVIETVRVTAL